MQALLEIPGDFAVSDADVAGHPVVSQLAEGRSQLIGLALWLMAEQALVRKLVIPEAPSSIAFCILPFASWQSSCC